MWAPLLFALSISIDGLGVGIVYGMKKTSVSTLFLGLIGAMSFASIVGSMLSLFCNYCHCRRGRQNSGDNIKKAVRYVLADKMGEVLAIFVAAVAGYENNGRPFFRSSHYNKFKYLKPKAVNDVFQLIRRFGKMFR